MGEIQERRIEEIQGEKWSQSLSFFENDEVEDKLTIIKGFPNCPLCGELLELRQFPEPSETYWHCTHCKTEWDTAELIEAINQAKEMEQNGQQG